MCVPLIMFSVHRDTKIIRGLVKCPAGSRSFPWEGAWLRSHRSTWSPSSCRMQTHSISEIPDEDESLLFEWWTVLHLSSTADSDWGSYGSAISVSYNKQSELLLTQSACFTQRSHLSLCSLGISCKQFHAPSRLSLADTNIHLLLITASENIMSHFMQGQMFCRSA